MDGIFGIGNLVALTGWAALLVALAWRPAQTWALRWSGIAIPVLMGIAYIGLMAYGREAFEHGGFNSIASVRTLFANDAALTAGWFHYLAFDLFVGTWIVREGRAANVHPLLILPALPLTFMFGPAGLLLFFVIRSAFARK